MPTPLSPQAQKLMTDPYGGVFKDAPGFLSTIGKILLPNPQTPYAFGTITPEGSGGDIVSKTIRELWSNKTRTTSVKNLIRSIEDGISYVADLSPQKAKAELSKSMDNWSKQLSHLQEIASGKREIEGSFFKDWQYRQGQVGKNISPDTWATDYGIPEAKTMIEKITNTGKSIDKLKLGE